MTGPTRRVRLVLSPSAELALAQLVTYRAESTLTDKIRSDISLHSFLRDNNPTPDTIVVSPRGIASSEAFGAPEAITSAQSAAARGVYFYLLSLSPQELLAIFLWLQDRMIATFEDSEASLYGTLVSLPFLALVLHALSRKRRGL